jgi:hypothetical protein
MACSVVAPGLLGGQHRRPRFVEPRVAESDAARLGGRQRPLLLMNVAREAVELGDDDRDALAMTPRLAERGPKLRATPSSVVI